MTEKFYEKRQFSGREAETALFEAAEWLRDKSEPDNIVVVYDYEEALWYVDVYIRKKRSE